MSKLYMSHKFQVVKAEIGGLPIFFSIDRRQDYIQKQHRAGRFYDTNGLELIQEHFPSGGTFVDIGTNIGNHTLFVGKFLNPKELILFEPNPEAIRTLTCNLHLNNIFDKCDLSFLGKGLSDSEESGFMIVAPDNNLGAGKMVKSAEEGTFETILGDHALRHKKVDFIKIDVEGMEMMVLRGLQATIARDRPKLFLELDDVNIDAFTLWANAHRYKIVARDRKYSSNENLMLLPE